MYVNLAWKGFHSWVSTSQKYFEFDLFIGTKLFFSISAESESKVEGSVSVSSKNLISVGHYLLGVALLIIVVQMVQMFVNLAWKCFHSYSIYVPKTL